jgi:hypothetical protein
MAKPRGSPLRSATKWDWARETVTETVRAKMTETVRATVRATARDSMAGPGILEMARA